MLAITTRSGTTTKDPPHPSSSPITPDPNKPHEEVEDMGIETPNQPPLTTPSQSTPPNQPVRIPFPSRLKIPRESIQEAIVLVSIQSF
jgi:hypothetical protein